MIDFFVHKLTYIDQKLCKYLVTIYFFSVKFVVFITVLSKPFQIYFYFPFQALVPPVFLFDLIRHRFQFFTDRQHVLAVLLEQFYRKRLDQVVFEILPSKYRTLLENGK